MAIPFKEIPTNLLVPGSYQEIDSSAAGSVSQEKRVLITGQKLAAGTATAGKLYQVTRGDGWIREQFGEGSDIARMIQYFRKYNKFFTLYAAAAADPTGTKAKETWTVAVTSPEAGTMAIYIDGIKVTVAVEAGDTASDIVKRAVSVINGVADLPLTASVGSSPEKLEFEALHTGSTGNTISICLNLFGEELPEGLSIDRTPMAGGTGDSDASTIIDKLPGTLRFNYFVNALTDSGNMKKWEEELDSRYTALRQIGGRMFIGVSGDFTEIAGGYMENRNNPHVSVCLAANNPQHPLIWAACYGAKLSFVLGNDPSANINGEPIQGLIPTEEFSFDERQKFLEGGVSTYTVSAGKVYVERQVTTFNKNVDGDRDTSYLDIQVPETVDAIRTHINSKARSQFIGYKLARNGADDFGSGKIMTPEIWESFLISTYREDFIRSFNWCQGLSEYKKSITVEISEENSKFTLSYIHQPELIGQFLIAAGVNQFI